MINKKFSRYKFPTTGIFKKLDTLWKIYLGFFDVFDVFLFWFFKSLFMFICTIFSDRYWRCFIPFSVPPKFYSFFGPFIFQFMQNANLNDGALDIFKWITPRLQILLLPRKFKWNNYFVYNVLFEWVGKINFNPNKSRKARARQIRKKEVYRFVALRFTKSWNCYV